MTDEELRKLFEALRTENADAHAGTRTLVARTAGETREYVDQSVELERRVRTLEQAFSDLQARVERLETTTH